MYLAEHESKLGETPYWLFISFLYAVIASDIAKSFARLSRRWSKYSVGRWPASTHLVLISMVVGTSWLGWTQFVQERTIFFNSNDGVLAPSSLLLIIDFEILALYFACGSVVHKARLSGGYGGSWDRQSAHASYWIWTIFNAYVAWDFYVYFVIAPSSWQRSWPMFAFSAMLAVLAIPILPLLSFVEPLGKGAVYVYRRVAALFAILVTAYILLPASLDRNAAETLWCKSWMSVLCAGLAALAFLVFQNIPERHSCRIITGDISLIALVLFYRGLKQLTLGSQAKDWYPWFAGIFLCIFVILGISAIWLNEWSAIDSGDCEWTEKSSRRAITFALASLVALLIIFAIGFYLSCDCRIHSGRPLRGFASRT